LWGLIEEQLVGKRNFGFLLGLGANVDYPHPPTISNLFTVLKKLFSNTNNPSELAQICEFAGPNSLTTLCDNIPQLWTGKIQPAAAAGSNKMSLLCMIAMNDAEVSERSEVANSHPTHTTKLN